MRLFNVIGIPVVAMIVVVIAFLAHDAHSAEQRPIWLSGLTQPVTKVGIFRRQDGLIEEAANFQKIDGVIGAVRHVSGELPERRTLPALKEDAFLVEAAKRFPEVEAPPGKTIGAPMPLTPNGDLRAGFVARVWVDKRPCDFAIAAYETEEAGKISVIARAIVCESASALAPADIRLAGLLARAD